MRIFNEFAEYPGVRQLVEQAAKLKTVQGVVFEIDPIWMTVWRLYERFGKDWLKEKILNYSRYYSEGFIVSALRVYEEVYLNDDIYIPRLIMNMRELDDIRNIFIEEFRFIGKPFIVRICHYPQLIERIKSFEDETILESSNERFQIVHEARPVSYLKSVRSRSQHPILGGISISGNKNTAGTLGGIFYDHREDKFYGVTCSHVVGSHRRIHHPAPIDAFFHRIIGKVIHSTNLVPLPEGMFGTKNLSMANELDLAVIEINQKAVTSILNIGEVTSIFPNDNLVPRTNVSFMGRSSGHKKLLYCDGEVAFYDFQLEGKTYRFKDLIQIRQEGKMTNLLTTPVQQGDSGSWICVPGTPGNAWCGMVIGCSEQTGFAIPSNRIVDWISSEIGLSVTFE